MKVVLNTYAQARLLMTVLRRAGYRADYEGKYETPDDKSFAFFTNADAKTVDYLVAETERHRKLSPPDLLAKLQEWQEKPWTVRAI